MFALPSIVCHLQLEYDRKPIKTLTVKCGLKLKRNGIRLYNLISKVFTNRLDGVHRVRPVRKFVRPAKTMIDGVR